LTLTLVFIFNYS